MLFLISLFAEFLANDKPILVVYQGGLYAPVLKDYPETTFGGTFDTAANYRDPYVAALIEDNGWMLWPPVRFSYRTVNFDLPVPAPAPPHRSTGWAPMIRAAMWWPGLSMACASL